MMVQMSVTSEPLDASVDPIDARKATFQCFGRFQRSTMPDDQAQQRPPPQ
jgi:hypothetical protein